ncbi:hypothetical protein, partial [Paramuribaculum intestinale]
TIEQCRFLPFLIKIAHQLATLSYTFLTAFYILRPHVTNHTATHADSDFAVTAIIGNFAVATRYKQPYII